MTKQDFSFHTSNPHAWMAQMINYAVTGQFYAQLSEQRRVDELLERLPTTNLLAFPVQPDRDYIPEPAANHGPMPEAA